jgi:3-hydroxyisobutyrate dehydrogenase-like beta-hydroxyacid dehydrogenase
LEIGLFITQDWALLRSRNPFEGEKKMALKVGFIGLGIMGQPMAQNVVKGGCELTVFNRSSEKAKPLADAGATVAPTPKAVAEASDVIILMLAGPEAIDAVLEGSEGLMAGMRKNQILINMSTVSPQYSKQLAEVVTPKSVTAIDAPVSGSRKPAEEGALVILAGGPKEKVTETEPLLMSMGKKVIYCGDVGQGSSMKMAVNLLLGIMAAGLSEAVNFGQKCGLDTATMLETMLAGPMGCALFEFKKPMLIDNQFSAQFPLKHMTKDIRFALQTADDIGAMVPIGHTAFQLYRQSVGLGLSDMDFAAVKKVFERISDS